MDGQIYRSYDDHVMQYGFREPMPAFGPGSPQPPTGAGKFRPTLCSVCENVPPHAVNLHLVAMAHEGNPCKRMQGGCLSS
jgi:hypothetical protein